MKKTYKTLTVHFKKQSISYSTLDTTSTDVIWVKEISFVQNPCAVATVNFKNGGRRIFVNMQMDYYINKQKPAK